MPRVKPPKRLQKFANSDPENDPENGPEVYVRDEGVVGERRRGRIPKADTIYDERKRMGEDQRENNASTLKRTGLSSGELEEARVRNEERRKARKDKQVAMKDKGHLTHRELSRFWLEAVAERFPDRAMPLTQKEIVTSLLQYYCYNKKEIV